MSWRGSRSNIMTKFPWRKWAPTQDKYGYCREWTQTWLLSLACFNQDWRSPLCAGYSVSFLGLLKENATTALRAAGTYSLTVWQSGVQSRGILGLVPFRGSEGDLLSLNFSRFPTLLDDPWIVDVPLRWPLPVFLCVCHVSLSSLGYFRMTPVALGWLTLLWPHLNKYICSESISW